MNEYKTLVRKSDGQKMGIMQGELIEVDVYELYGNMHSRESMDVFSKFDWSLYELTPVVVIRKDQMPSDEEIKVAFPLSYKFAIQIINWFKSKILKP